jgi:arginyl-tRNA synthetase
LQYAHARACSILRKAGAEPSSVDASRLTEPEEQSLVRSVARFPLAIEDAVEANEPSTVARYLLELAAEFSKWYTLGNQQREKRVLVNDPSLRSARLALTESVRLTLASGLSLLGIPAPENM